MSNQRSGRTSSISDTTLPSPIASQIAFMHIPKTAGISVVDAFVERLGPRNCLSFSSTIGEEEFKEKRFVSGHVYLNEITTDAFIFSFFREPLKQIVSHLLWIDHYNMPEYEGEILGFSGSVQQAIKWLKPVDFSSARDLNEYLSKACNSELRIKNLQAEMLSFCRGQVPLVENRQLAKIAISALSRLNFIGISEQVDGDMAALFNKLDLGQPPAVKKLNASPSLRTIDLTNPAIRNVLEPYVEADLRLYEHILRARDISGLGSFRRVFKGVFSALTR